MVVAAQHRAQVAQAALMLATVVLVVATQVATQLLIVAVVVAALAILLEAHRAETVALVVS